MSDTGSSTGIWSAKPFGLIPPLYQGHQQNGTDKEHLGLKADRPPPRPFA